MNAPLPLVRPSQLARFWELHPKTVYLWIREGRLPAVRTPGDQFRLRATDVRAFCEARGMPLPPFARDLVRRALVVAGTPGATRVLRRTLRSLAIDVEAFDASLDALLACAFDPPSLLCLDASARDVRADDATRALRKSPATLAMPILVYNVASAAKGEALVQAGATRIVQRGRDREIPAAIAAIFP